MDSPILSALGLTGSTAVDGFMSAALNSGHTTGSGDLIVTPTAATPVPEPTTGLLLLTGLGMIGLASLIGAKVGKHSHTANNEGEQSERNDCLILLGGVSLVDRSFGFRQDVGALELSVVRSSSSLK